ncbi:transglutaminase-like domain-containing protein [Chloroflexota bacterium]
MQSLWKKLFIAMAVLFVVSSSIGGVLWYQQGPVRMELGAARSQLSSVLPELETAKDELTVVKSQLGLTSNRLAIAEYNLNQWLTRYYYLREQIYTRMADGPSIIHYFTPNEPAITDVVQEVTEGYSPEKEEWWKDVSRINRWVTDNIKYTTDSYLPILPANVSDDLIWQRDFWRLPVETLQDRAGDCEDASLLLASMLSNYNEGRLEVWIIGVQNENRRHIAVAFPVATGLLAILDPAGNYYTWHYSWSELRAYEVAVVIRNWMRDWEPVMPDAEVYAIFTDQYYIPFTGTEQFVDWFRATYAPSYPLKVYEEIPLSTEDL